MTAVVGCVGLTVLDTVFSLSGPLGVGVKQVAQSTESRVGGPAANAAAAIVALGGGARLIAKVGLDFAGDEVMAKLDVFGVEHAYIRRIDSPTSTSTVIVTPRGERTIVNHTANAINDDTDLPSLTDLDGCRSVLVDMRWPAAAGHAIDLARQLSVPCVVDADVALAADSMGLVGNASHVIFSEPALRVTSDEADVDAALLHIDAAMDAFVGVTLGDDGFSWVQDGKIRKLSAIEVPVVNTSGAGDVFHGAFALGLAEGMDIESNLERASAAAAFSCASPVALNRFATNEDVRSLLESSGLR